MLATTDVLRVVIDGVTYWQYPDGVRLPIMAGGAPEDEDEDRTGDETEDDDETSESEDDRTGRGDDDDEDDETSDSEDRLPRWAQDLLANVRRGERRAKREAAKLRRQQSRAGDGDRARRARRAEDETEVETGPDAGTVKLRQANLKLALTDKGYTGSQARMLVRLLDGVDFDADDEPVDLDGALEEAADTYGDVVRPAKSTKPKAPKTDSGAGKKSSEKAPALTAEELKMAKSFGMTAAEYQAYKDPQHRPAEKKAD